VTGRSSGSQAGFSFIEIVIALALFAAATSLIVGLQTSAVNRTLRDRNAQHAMLAARRIMASVEAAGQNLEIADQDSQPVAEVLRTLGVPEQQAPEDAPDPDGNLTASLKVEDWELPFEHITNPAMKRVTLRIAWGDGPQESFLITYLVPAPRPT